MALMAFSGRLLPFLSIRTYYSQKENGSVLAHLCYLGYLSDLPLLESLSVAEDGPFQLWNTQPRKSSHYVILLNSFYKNIF